MGTILSPKEITENFVQTGVVKVSRPTGYLIVTGILAGVLIALGSAATNTATYGFQEPWIARTICGLLFPFGLGMVIVMGAELFTGNSLILITVLNKKCTVLQMLRNWVIVYFANLLGSIIIAAGCVFGGQLNYSNSQLAVSTMKIAAAKCTLPLSGSLILGFFCNFLVCLGVLMAMSAKDTFGKIIGAFLPVCYFVICGFEHCVANMYYIPAGLFAKTNPEYVSLALKAGVPLENLTVSGFLFGNLLPVTIGNILGGAAIALIMWYCHLRTSPHQ